MAEKSRFTSLRLRFECSKKCKRKHKPRARKRKSSFYFKDLRFDVHSSLCSGWRRSENVACVILQSRRFSPHFSLGQKRKMLQTETLAAQASENNTLPKSKRNPIENNLLKNCQKINKDSPRVFSTFTYWRAIAEMT